MSSSYRGKKKGGNNRRTPPKGFEYMAPILDALENELRDKVKESNANKRNTESVWPIHQIHWQRSRYVYDMYYTHKKISREVYDYCLKHKIADAALIAKWKKPGYERLCSTYVINPSNYKFGTTSICRVPLKDRDERQMNAQDPTTGCLGCASGNDGRKNIFGNKYGQNLAAVQVAREKRMEEIHKKRMEKEEEERRVEAAARARDEGEEETDDDDDDDDDEGPKRKAPPPPPPPQTKDDSGDSETDDDSDSDDDDYGPSPAAGVWAGSTKLEEEAAGGGDNDDDEKEEAPPAKKLKSGG